VRARERRARIHESWGEPPEPAPEIVWTAEALFKVLDLHFAGSDGRRRDAASFAQTL
jgi:hypothetical protein